jgi:hypothetical protein
MIFDILALPPHDMGLLGHQAAKPPRARPWGPPEPPPATRSGTNPTKKLIKKKSNIQKNKKGRKKNYLRPGRRGDAIDTAASPRPDPNAERLPCSALGHGGDLPAALVCTARCGFWTHRSASSLPTAGAALLHQQL